MVYFYFIFLIFKTHYKIYIKELFWKNPQYLICLEGEPESTSTILISLLQDPPHLSRNIEFEKGFPSMIFVIYKVCLFRIHLFAFYLINNLPVK
jgi:hypothetical protein